MRQKDTVPYIVEAIKRCGGRATTRQLQPIMLQLCPTDGYDFRWCQQIGRQQGVIGVDKSVYPNEWYIV